jgi:hypothetical protein
MLFSGGKLSYEMVDILHPEISIARTEPGCWFLRTDLRSGLGGARVLSFSCLLWRFSDENDGDGRFFDEWGAE